MNDLQDTMAAAYTAAGVKPAATSTKSRFFVFVAAPFMGADLRGLVSKNPA